MGFITAERGQRDIIGFSIDDFVEEDSKCRYIVRLIDKLDLKELYSNYKGQGAESYDPKIMLAIWFLAYSEGITSSRELEKLCHKHLDFIYISANLRPDHSTLCRFMQRNGDLWPKYFTQIVEMGKKMHISDFKEVMIDGTKLKAKSSRKQSMRERKISRYMEAVKKDIEEYKTKLSLMEKEEASLEETTTEKAEDLKNLKKKLHRLEKTEELLKTSKDELVRRKQTLRPHLREGHQINLQEPDAMMMDHSLGQGYHPGYNAQIAVDSKTQFIVSCSLTQDRNDQRQFSVMHEMTENMLGGNKKRVYGADSGYNTFDQLGYIDENDVNAYVRDPMLKNLRRESLPELIESKRKLYHVDFIYDKYSDSYTCPAGEKLLASESKSGKSKSERGSKRKYYRRKDCSGCPLFSQCLGENSKKKGKEIEGDIREYLAEAMRLKMMSPEAEEIMMKRQTSVEPVFGYIKETLGFRRFRRKGLRNAAREFAFICMAVNINKLFRLRSFKGLSSTIFIVLFTLKALLDDLRARFTNQLRISLNYPVICSEPFHAQAFC